MEENKVLEETANKEEVKQPSLKTQDNGNENKKIR